jgi:hypothetical protein
LQGDESRIRVSKNTMSVTDSLIRRSTIGGARNTPRNDLATLEGLPEVFLDLLVSNVRSNFLLHGHLPSQNFLISESIFLHIQLKGLGHAKITNPCRGPARAKSAAEYERYGSESVEPTKSGKYTRIRVLVKQQ